MDAVRSGDDYTQGSLLRTRRNVSVANQLADGAAAEHAYCNRSRPVIHASSCNTVMDRMLPAATQDVMHAHMYAPS
jgi:hypothetical protein